MFADWQADGAGRRAAHSGAGAAAEAADAPGGPTFCRAETVK